MTPSEIADWLSDEARYRKCGHTRYAQAAATIRAQAEALKIATEALEDISVAEFYETTCTTALNALARIKGVG